MLDRQESTEVHKCKGMGMITLPSHSRAPDPIEPNSNVQYVHLSSSMLIELVLRLDIIKATVQQRFAVSNIYDSSFGLNILKGEKPYFKAPKII